MSYNTWVRDKFPSILSLRVAKNSIDGTTAIFSLKDREFNIINIIDDALAIYNTMELYDSSLFFDRFYFIFKDTLTEIMKVVYVTNTTLLQYVQKQIDFKTLKSQIDIRDIKMWQQEDGSIN